MRVANKRLRKTFEKIAAQSDALKKFEKTAAIPPTPSPLAPKPKPLPANFLALPEPKKQISKHKLRVQQSRYTTKVKKPTDKKKSQGSVLDILKNRK